MADTVIPPNSMGSSGLSVCLELVPETGDHSPGGHYKGSDDDVIKAIKYAKENNITVAVRTGGHQYSGASSTNGDNIQLDVSETYQDFEWEDDDCTIVTLGISISLDDFNKNFGGKRRFLPHGQCQYVHVASACTGT
ncbi:231_t:CDS:2 [Paraglomus occultum]|uniref:231_t:CDS:1 n=1 Tax=Paraglomus occultum TaxID=144539 RepID=A0A9N8WGS9_9GLOM|nr:231_t:CDS:2 [Paraglomus occultum]